MREEEEKFIRSPMGVFQQESVYIKIDVLTRKMDLLEQRIGQVSKILNEILSRLEPSENFFESKITKKYGFEAQTEFD